jgi:hypothetical protein
MTWNIWVIIISVLLLVFLFWKEIKRTNKQRLTWRLLASLIAVSSLVFLAIPVSFKGKKNSVAQNEILLLTDGFSKDNLDKYRGSSPHKPLIYTADETVFKREKSPDIRFVADLDTWQKTIPANATLHILGFGLSEDNLQSLNQKPVRFTAPELPSGIQKINWIHRLNAGENFRVQGSFLNQTGDKIKLVLKGLNTGLDSVEIGAKRSMDFSFSTIPKQSGQAVFRLVALSGKDTIENEPIPIQIEPAKTLKVLMLSASPDFESRFLKNWLAENAYGVAARSTISKNKTTTAFANLNKLPLEKITQGLLQNFDVLITDAAAFASLSKPETAAIVAQTSAKGMGLIFRADSSGNASFISKNFPVYQSDMLQKQLTLKLKDEANTHLNILVDRPVFIRNQSGTQNIVQDEAAHLLVNSKLYGSGKLLLSTLNNTFSWQLSGKPAAYSAFWSMLLSKAAKKVGRKENVFTPFLPDKNSMVPIMLETSNPIASAKVNGTAITFSQNPAIPFLQEGFYWPDKAGWQTVSGGGMSAQSIYIFENTNWRSLKAEQKIRSTQQYAQQFVAMQQNFQNQQKEERIFIPSFWFYLLFLLSCTFLWFETKLL